MSKFDEDLHTIIEDVKDRMAERLKEYCFEVDETYIYPEISGDKLAYVDVDIVGEFTGLDGYCLNTASGSILAAILRDCPYSDVVTFIHNISSIKVDTGLQDAVKIMDVTKKENTSMYAWSGLDFYEIFKGDKEAKELEELLHDYMPIVREGLNNWVKNIRKEYIIEFSKEYWKLMDKYQTEKCRNGDIFK